MSQEDTSETAFESNCRDTQRFFKPPVEGLIQKHSYNEHS